jgi:hypothetical protein
MPGLTYIQGASAAGDTCLLSGAVKGDLVFVACSNFFGVNHITDSWGTTYTPLESATNGITVGALYCGTVFADGDMTVSVNFSGTSTPSIAVAEFRYVGTLTSDGGSTGTGLAVTSLAAGNVSLTGNDLVVTMLSTDRASVTTPSGYTAGPAYVASGPTYGVAMAYLLGASGSTNPTWTQQSGDAVAAVYAYSLEYIPATLPVPYVSKSGQAFVLGATANTTSSAAISGTVSVVTGSTQLVSSAPQANWIGWELQISGDSSSGTYTVIGGQGRSWVITPAYGGATAAVNAAATLIQNYPAAPITAINNNPTVSVQFGGTGGVDAISIAGPFWPSSGGCAFAFWQLLCGGVSAAIIQDPGANYSANPTVAASGGGGTAPTFGSPVVSGGVTSFTGVSGTYSTAPTVIIAPPPAIPITGTFTTGSVSVTGITSTAGLYPGMTALGSGPLPNVIATVPGSTSLTLALPATVSSGSHTVDIYGKQAMATAVLSGGSLVALDVFVPGTGYSLASPPAVTFSTGNGAATAVVTRVIADIPVLTPGSGNTGPITITVSDADGSGAVIVPLMSGVAPSDVVSYSAVDSWYAIAAGTAPPSSFSGSTVTNYSGELEPGFGGLLGFNRPSNQRLLKLGYNVPGAQAGAYYSSFYPLVNWFKRASSVSNAVTQGYDQRPLTINGTAVSPTSWGVSNTTPTQVDGNYFPSPVGVWTLKIDEVNPTNPLLWSFTSANFAASIGSPVFTEGVSTTGVNAITLTSGGSGFTSTPTVTINGNGTGATGYAIICDGSVIAVYLGATGVGYTGSVTITISGGGGIGATATATIGSVLSGRTWQWNVDRNSTADNLGLQLNCWRTVGGTYNYTATNEWLFDPTQTAAALPGLPARSGTFNAATLNSLTTPSANTPYTLRYMDARLGEDGYGNAVDPEDDVQPQQWTYFTNYFNAASTPEPTRTRGINVTAIRTYALSTSGYPAGWNVSWSSPKVFWPQKNANGVATPGWIGYGSGSEGGPFYTTPATVGYLSTGAPSPDIVVEFVTNVPHNLKAGQQVFIASGTGTYTQSAGPTNTYTNVALPGFESITVYPTGPTTFAALMYPTVNTDPFDGSGAGLPGGLNTVAGTFTIAYVFDVAVPQGTQANNTFPCEVVAAGTGALPRTNLWLNINHAVTDDYVTQTANEALANFPAGRLQAIEVSNEVWSGTPPAGYFASMAALGAWGGNDPISSYVIRTAQIHDIYEAAATAVGRGGEVFRLFGAQGGYAGPAGEVIATANANDIKVDGVPVANYISVTDDPSVIALGASLATHWPTSSQYQGVPVSRALYCDWLRHYVMYNVVYTASMVDQQIALNNYNVRIGSTQLPIPVLCGYEGSWQQVIASDLQTVGNDPQGGQLYNQVTTDIYYAPPFYDVEMAYYWWCQQGGMAFINIESLGGAFTTYIWPHYAWSGQPWGKGDGSAASNGVDITNVSWSATQVAHHDINVAVPNWAWQDWADDANGPTSAPTTATLSGPETGMEGVPVTFVINLDEPAQAGGVSCVVTSSVVSDAIATSPVAIAEGETAATFTVTASLGGTHTITLASTTPSLTIAGSPITLTITVATQWFEQALVAELQSIPALTSILGTQAGGSPAIFKTGPPQTWQYSTNGTCLSYTIPTKPKGQVLTGSDGTATARVQLDLWSFTQSDVKMAMQAIFNDINGPFQTWGNGTCVIVSSVHQADNDADEAPQTGSDQWLYHSFSEYQVMYRLSTGGG